MGMMMIICKTVAGSVTEVTLGREIDHKVMIKLRDLNPHVLALESRLLILCQIATMLSRKQMVYLESCSVGRLSGRLLEVVSLV